jgi:hypothetical protein
MTKRVVTLSAAIIYSSAQRSETWTVAVSSRMETGSLSLAAVAVDCYVVVLCGWKLLLVTCCVGHLLGLVCYGNRWPFGVDVADDGDASRCQCLRHTCSNKLITSASVIPNVIM